MQFSHTFVALYAVALYAVALAGFVAAQGGLTVATPASLVQCQPAQLSWSGGTAPYFPSIIPGSQPGAAALKSFPSQQGTSLTWSPVDLPQGSSITIQVRDNTGAVQYSSAVTIQNSADASCLNGGASSGAPGASTPAASTPASTPGASTPAGSTPGPSSAAPSTSRPASSAGSSTRPAASGSSASASATAKPNSASSVTKGAFGVAAIAGLIGAALL